MAQDGDGEWLNISEAARRLGISRQAIQQRIRRKAIVWRHDNTGAPQVFIASAKSKYSSASSEPAVADVAATSAPAVAGLLSLTDVRQLLGEQRSAHESAMAALQASHRESVQLLIERVDAAEVARETLAAQMAELVERLSRPWWTGWVGSSKRSTIR